MLEVISVLLFVLLELLALNDGSCDGEKNDEEKVEVEVPFHVGERSLLELVDQVEFVGEASSVEGDSTDEEVGSTERGC